VNPLNALFGAGVALRNRLYDSGTLQQQKLQHPVISIGNISVGGSGKTPFVMLLGRLLQQNKIAFDILSRGFGREDNHVRLVDVKGKSSQFGDEPLLLARELEVPVIVGGDRVAAGQYAEKLFAEAKPAHGEWIHLLDDGFQHRSLWRDVDIVLLSRQDLQGSLLPTGRLREPPSSLLRADVIVLTDDTREADISDITRGKTTWRVRRKVTLASTPPANVVAFCGVARSERFFADLESLGVNTEHRRIFRDHHRYTEIDAENLLALKKRSGAEAFITTAKDIMNLESVGLLPALQPLIELRLRMEFVAPEPNAVFQTLMQMVT
jgi:tetraacyldisaccharide 4'-kinase